MIARTTLPTDIVTTVRMCARHGRSRRPSRLTVPAKSADFWVGT